LLESVIRIKHEAEGTAGHVLGQSFDTGLVSCFQADAAVDAEAALAPGQHLFHELQFDIILCRDA